jgi:succinoglycan biosynthesis protein ExoA
MPEPTDEARCAQPGPPPPPPGEAPTFSIIVPMRNEERYVAETIESLVRQDYPPERVEILVVDGRSSDGSRDIVARLARTHPALRLLGNPRLVAAAARNIGIGAARGRFIGIVDCHSFVNPDFLGNAERLFEDTGADCLGRPVELVIPTDSYLQRVIGVARTSWLGHHLVSPRYGRAQGRVSPLSVGILYRREVFDRIGLFNEKFAACEDVEFNSRLERAGLTAWTDASLRCWYHPRGSLWALFNQIRRYAYWRHRLARSQRRAFHISQVVPAAAGIVGLGALAAAAARWVPAAVPLSLMGAYAALVALACARASRRRGLRYLPLLPAAFFTIHLGAAVGLWAALLEDVRARLSPGGWSTWHGRPRL